MKKFCFLLILMILVTVAGCALFAGSTDITSNITPAPLPAFSAINSDLDKSAKELMSDFFAILFTAPSVDKYTENTRTGQIPDSIIGYISEQTVKEGNGNPEIGIHLPRYISINGMTIIGYDIVRLGEDAIPDITFGYVGKNGDNLLYFCKIIARVKAVPDDIFLECYELQEDYTYKSKKTVTPDDIDGMRVEIRYDVELENIDGGLKILRAVETNSKPGLKNRLFILNNDSITRLLYLDTSRTADGSTYNNPADGEIYDREKAVIVNFLENLVKLDRERMNLLSHKWTQGLNEVKDYWDSLGISKVKDGEAQIIILTEEYKQSFPYESLPLRFDMERLKEVKNFVVTPHPAYSDKIKRYFVDFDAAVQKTNGITDEDYQYHFDYVVNLSDESGKPVIQNIKLNEYYAIYVKQEKQSNQ